MKDSQKDYEQLHKISRHSHLLGGIHQLLDWDQETYMPAAAAGIRAAQQEALAGVIHGEKTSKKFVLALSKLIHLSTGKILGKGLSFEQKAALKVWRKDYVKEAALPKQFVEEFAKIASQSMTVWRSAKKADAFHQFAPYLDKIVMMARKKAEFLGYKNHPYDALLDLYEPGLTTAHVTKLFGMLERNIVPFLKQIMLSKPIEDGFLHGKYSAEKQLEFSKRILKDMGYSFESGRLDLSAHPFSSSYHPTDSRITTRIHPTSLISCISVVLHEAGHSHYATGLPVEHYGSPLGEAISLGMHESQSRWYETFIGQSKAYWHYYLPLLKEVFPKALDGISLSTFYRALNKVSPSYIRVDADEITYPLHVILRFELEKALIEGSLSIRELPDAWNAKMQELLGITPKTNAEGCLQDVHWSWGAFGYFPTYTLGNMYAAHFFTAFVNEYPDWEARVAQGELLFIKEWLHQAIHRHGRCYSSLELLEKVTGSPFSSEAYIDYLTTKYSDIYQIQNKE